jgi:hypothetical protein
MKVIFFPRKVSGAGGSSVENPYTDYKDYLKENIGEGSYKIESENQIRSDDISASEIRISTLSWSKYGERIVLTWVFHAPQGEFALETDVLKDRFPKLKSLILAALRTFTVFKPGESEGDQEKQIPLSKMTPEQRKEWRIATTEKIFEKAKADLPAGWGHFETKNFLVIHHTSKNKAMRYSKQAEACWKWLDKKFGKVGDEHVCKCILRVCENWDEEKIYRSGSDNATKFTNREITTNVDSEEKRGEFEWINRRVMAKYFSDKNPELWEAMPFWMDEGLAQYVGTSVARGGRLVFRPDMWERETLRDARKTDSVLHVKKLILEYRREIHGGQAPKHVLAQCGSVVRYLFGPGNRGYTKGLIFRYIRNLLEALAEHQKNKSEEIRSTLLNSEELKKKSEAELEKEVQRIMDLTGSWAMAKTKVLKMVFERTFKGWTDATWNGFDKSWQQFSR